jgi:hypothetical protein
MEEVSEFPGANTDKKTSEADIFVGPMSNERKPSITITIRR